jgi:hypothetical protein
MLPAFSSEGKCSDGCSSRWGRFGKINDSGKAGMQQMSVMMLQDER